MNNEWDELDVAAEANLQGKDLAEFWQKKKQLKVEGHAWDDAHDILTGFIWDATEEG